MGSVEYHREYYHNNKEKWNRWRTANPDKVKKSKHAHYLRHKEKYGAAAKEHRYSIRGLYLIYRRSARKRNIDFNIKFEDFESFLYEKTCHYCGGTKGRVGLDRVDNTRGYFWDNVVPCCTACNKMKGTMDYDEFVETCTRIANLSNFTATEKRFIG